VVWLWTLFGGCTPSGPRADEPSVGRVVAASTFPPTANGVDAPVLGPVQSATKSRAAFDGEQFLVVWEDLRGSDTTVSAARMGRNGELLDPEDIALPSAFPERAAPAVAFDGTDFLVVWQERKSSSTSYRVSGIRLGKDGRTVGAPVVISADPSLGNCEQPAIAYDGTNYLVVWHYFGSSKDRIDGARVSPLGVVLDNPAPTLVQMQEYTGGAVTPPGLVFGGASYLVGWAEGGKILASRFSPALVRLDAAGVELASGTSSFDPALAWDGTQYWAAFNTYAPPLSSPMVRRVGANGAALGQPETIATDASNGFPAIAADGTGALAPFSRGPNDEGDLFGGVLDPTSGAAVGTPSLVATVGSQWNPSVARGDATTPFLLSWSDTRHAASAIYGSRLDSNRAATDGTGVLLSVALNKQNEPAVVASTSGFLVAWQDGREGGPQVYGTDLDPSGAPLHAIARSFTSGRPSRGDVSIASDGTKYFAVWDENDFSGNYPALGRIIGPDGTPETAPVVLDSGSALKDPAVAFGGGNYFVIGTQYVAPNYQVSGARVSRSGALLATAPLPITSGSRFVPAVASDGTDFLIVWTDGSAAVGLRVDANGVVKDSSPFTISPAGASINSYPKVAYGGGSYFVIWRTLSSPTALLGARVNSAGAVLDATPIAVVPGGTLPKLETPLGANVAFDGTSFMVAWRSAVVDSSTAKIVSNDFKLTPVSPSGAVGAPSYVAPNDDSNFNSNDSPAVASTRAGTTVVAYTQLDNPAGYEIPRVRIRSFTLGSRLIGSACAANSECPSGNCVDGVCCDSACGGGGADCTACSIVSGAPKNGICTTLADGHSCGRAGTCASGTCAEPPDAGSGSSGGAPATGGSAGASGTASTGGTPNAGGAGNPSDASPPLVDGATSQGGGSVGAAPSAGGVGASGSGGALQGGKAGTISGLDGATSDDTIAGPGENSGGCGCRTARESRPLGSSATALFVTACATLLVRRRRPSLTPRR
jgi:hypothetical protein